MAVTAGVLVRSKGLGVARRQRGPARRAVAALAAGFAALVVVLLVVVAVVTGTETGGTARQSMASAEAIADIPAVFMGHYQEAATTFGVDWAVLAAVGKVECDHGRSQLAGCNPPGTVNSAGARGPMQFLGGTWRAGADSHDPDVAGAPVPTGEERLGYATDGDGDGTADPWSAADSIHAAARMLRHNGAPDDVASALHAYNPSNDYVASVTDYAARYRAHSDTQRAEVNGSPGDVPLTPVGCAGGGTTTVHSQLAPAVEGLYAAAADAGHRLCGGGYRDGARQVELRRQNCGTSTYAIYEMPSSRCSPPTARPGSSNHEMGLAIDITCDGALIRSRSSPCFTWLDAHAADHGLANLPSEPWHWSNDGT